MKISCLHRLVQLERGYGITQRQERRISSVQGRRKVRLPDRYPHTRIEAFRARGGGGFRVPLRLRSDGTERPAKPGQVGIPVLWAGLPPEIGNGTRRRVTVIALQAMVGHARTLLQREQQVVSRLWGARHPRLRQMAVWRGRSDGIRMLRGRHGAAWIRDDYREKQFGRPLRAEELLLGKPHCSEPQQAVPAPCDPSRAHSAGFSMGGRSRHSIFHSGRSPQAGLDGRESHNRTSTPPLKALMAGGWK